MDDLILIHHDKEYLSFCLSVIEDELRKNGMEMHEKKTFIQKISEPIRFLGFDYYVKQSGKIVILVAPEKIKHERKKIQRMVCLYQKGQRTKYEIDRHFKAFKASIRFGNSHTLICRLNRWYKSLWEGIKNDVDNQKV